jgi:deoxyhypusine synthase
VLKDRTGVAPAARPGQAGSKRGSGVVRAFMEHHYRHFNARETVAAARAYEEHIDGGGKMLMTLAGAMSTAQLGVILARMIREGKVHAISCTGANLEEDVFNLLANKEYEIIQDWRALSAADEQALYDRGMNRVTDTCIPEDVMRHLERRLIDRWKDACDKGERKTPSEFLFDIIGSGELEEHYQIDPANSWMIAAKEMGVPVWSPGWEDSTTGNMFAANVLEGVVPHHQCVKSGTEQFEQLIRWYLENNGAKEGLPSVGFFQIGGGIAGDFAICTVPSIIQDMKRDVPFWGYFAQITDATTSYGGYSGAPPNEKITWGKLTAETPKFFINSDAAIVAPLIFAYVLND